MPSQGIIERLAGGEALLLDGGTGSELQRRGADVLKGASDRLQAWSATANIEFADVVRQVHQDYLRVGADVIISNNFWTFPSRLSSIGLADRWEEYATAAGAERSGCEGRRKPGSLRSRGHSRSRVAVAHRTGAAGRGGDGSAGGTTAVVPVN